MVALLVQAAAPAEQIGAINTQILDYIKVLLVLGGILLLAFVAIRAWAPRFMAAGRAGSGPLEVMGRLALDGRKTLYVVKAGGDCFLIGTSESDLHYLTGLDAGAIQSAAEAAPATDGAFARLVRAGRKNEGQQ